MDNLGRKSAVKNALGEDAGVDDLGGGEMEVSLEMFVLFLLVAAVGSVILYRTANKKWGYTEKRERELEEGKGWPGKKR